MNRVILHIGAGKCGSSALQEFFSHNPEHRVKNGGKLIYGVLLPTGAIISNDTVTKAARSSVYNYRTSTPLHACEKPARAVFEKALAHSLGRVDGDVILLSNEGWCYESTAADLFNTAFREVSVKAIMYVRPPVLFLNSAWWQWGAWSNLTFENWLVAWIKQSYWSEMAKMWLELPFVNEVEVRPLNGDILDDFITREGLCDIRRLDGGAASNKSLPNTILRIFQHCRELKPSLHSAAIDFSMSRYIQIEGKPDWILNGEHVRKILEETKRHNMDLMQFMSLEDQMLVRDDERWWSCSAYAENSVQDPEQQALREEETLELLKEALAAVHKLHEENVELRQQLAERRGRLACA